MFANYACRRCLDYFGTIEQYNILERACVIGNQNPANSAKNFIPFHPVGHGVGTHTIVVTRPTHFHEI